MKEKRDKKLFILSMIMMAFSSIISVYAASYLFESEQVSYDNTSSGLTSTNVQDSLDELYNHATDYTSMDTRVTALENKFPSNSTSSFTEYGLKIGVNTPSTYNSYIDIYNNNTIKGNIYSGYNSPNGLTIAGKSELNLMGNTVKINNTNINDYFKTTSTQFSTTLKKQLNAHSGDTFTNLLTNQPSVSVPSGYTLVSHVYIEISGIPLVNCIFDSMSNTTKTSNINGYIYNSSTGNVPSGYNIKVNIVSLWRKS